MWENIDIWAKRTKKQKNLWYICSCFSGFRDSESMGYNKHIINRPVLFKKYPLVHRDPYGLFIIIPVEYNWVVFIPCTYSTKQPGCNLHCPRWLHQKRGWKHWDFRVAKWWTIWKQPKKRHVQNKTGRGLVDGFLQQRWDVWSTWSCEYKSASKRVTEMSLKKTPASKHNTQRDISGLQCINKTHPRHLKEIGLYRSFSADDCTDCVVGG